MTVILRTPLTVITIRKVWGTVNLQERARTFYILTIKLRFFCGFSVNSRAVDYYFMGFTRKICCWEMPLVEFEQNRVVQILCFLTKNG